MNQIKIGKFAPLDYAHTEALNTLCTNLSFAGENVRKLLFTSCHAAEGKSYLSMNAMRTMAKMGKKVALVDTDLRKSVIVNQFDLKFSNPEKPGLAHYLAGMADVEDVVYATNIENAYMVPVGRTVSNPLQLLTSERFKQLLAYLEKRVDYVILDAAPVGVVIDAAKVAEVCDGIVVVVTYNEVHRQELIDVKQQLEMSGCPILGTVLNMVEYDSYLSKKYYYKTYYSKYGKYKKYGYYSKYSYEPDTTESMKPKSRKKANTGE